MDSVVIETHNLTKRYGERVVAVDSLNLRLRRGEVYGFLGPNGAGKTTTLRMLLGLIHPTSGRATVLGEPPGSLVSLSRLGALVESPAFYPYLSGWDNLRVLALHAGIPKDRIGAVLDQVNLATRARDAFKTYSLGMKQRLGIAAALLKDPELLILDEPTSGLDPAGMTEIRALIRKLGHGNRTVLLSSHLMNDVEQVCDRVGVLHGGRLVAEGRVDELRGEGSLRVRAYPIDQAQEVLSRLPEVASIQVADGALGIAAATDQAAQINRALVNAGIAVSELYAERASLESIFLKLTQNGGESHVE